MNTGDHISADILYVESTLNQTNVGFEAGLGRATVTNSSGEQKSLGSINVEGFVGVKNNKIGAEIGISNSYKFDKTINFLGFQRRFTTEFTFGKSFGVSAPIPFKRIDLQYGYFGASFY